jgi:hypothetical protein
VDCQLALQGANNSSSLRASFKGLAQSSNEVVKAERKAERESRKRNREAEEA